MKVMPLAEVSKYAHDDNNPNRFGYVAILEDHWYWEGPKVLAALKKAWSELRPDMTHATYSAVKKAIAEAEEVKIR